MKDTQTIGAELSTPERLLLFCVASDTELEAGVTRSTIAAMIIRGLIQRDPLGRLSLTKQGRDTLAALLRMVVSLVGASGASPASPADHPHHGGDKR
jgi:hypothetical protein